MNLLSFAEALEASKHYKKRHLLLGNGFSISCRPKIFRYDRLLEEADFTDLSLPAQAAFQALSTSDFERVIRSLRDTATISSLYKVADGTTVQMQRDAEVLREILIRTISENHPAYPKEIHDHEYRSCEVFLKHFATIYTLNYDLLVYWTFMYNRDTNNNMNCDDGFRAPETDDIENNITADYVVWDAGHHQQNLWFLHGALHIFDSQTEIQKYTWSRTGVPLIDQIRSALEKNLFPLFVSEGTTEEKYEKVRHSDYLSRAYRSFQEIGNCLFIYGHSLAENDEHFLRLIEHGKLSHIFIGLYDDPQSPAGQAIIRRAKSMQMARDQITRGKRPLQVDFYDSKSAQVWDGFNAEDEK